jgi:hypothetical protein
MLIAHPQFAKYATMISMKLAPFISLRATLSSSGAAYPQIDSTGESAGAEATNGCRRDLGEIDRSYDNSLADAHTRNKAPCVYRRHAAAIGHEDGDADEPEDAELARGPDATEVVTGEEGPEITTLEQSEMAR